MKIKHSTTAVDDIIFELTQSERMFSLLQDFVTEHFKDDILADITVDEEDEMNSIVDDIINKMERM